MTDSHAQLEAWLVDGATGDPPRETAVHATFCESCTARLGAFDALALIDVAAAGSPPPLVPPTRLRVWMTRARVGTAVAGTIVAGMLVVFSLSQLMSFAGEAGGPAGGPEGTQLAGVAYASDRGLAQSPQQSAGDSGPAEAETPSGFETPVAGVTPGPLPSFAPGPTPPPPTPGPATAGPTPTSAPTPIDSSPTPEPSPTPTPTPTPSPTPTPGPSPTI